MEVISKYELTYANATSNIPYPDTDDGEELWTAGTYARGIQKVQDGKIYEVVALNTSDSITDGLVASPATWIYVKPANFYRPISNDDDTAATQADSIWYEVTAAEIISGIGLFGVSGVSVTVTVNNTNIDPIDPIYDETQSAVDNSEVYDWVSYWTLPSDAKETFYFDDLPTFLNSTTRITVNAPSGTASLENLVIGELVDVGETLSRMAPKLRSTSRFIGATQISSGSVRELEASVKYDTAKHDYIYRRMERMNDVTTLWAGTSKFSTSVVLGVGSVEFEVTNIEKSDATYSIRRYTQDGN